jgi:Fe-S cluster assembly protein SufD
MVEAPPEVQSYLAEFAAFERRQGRRRPWLEGLRRRAIERFAALGFPTTRQEDWRYTSVAPVTRTEFRPAPAGDRRLPHERVAEMSCFDHECVQVVFVDGRHAPEYSLIPALPDRVRIEPLDQAVEGDLPEVAAQLGRHARFDEHPFAALNTAFVEDGAYVLIPPGTVVERPIHLMYFSTAHGTPAFSQPRTLIVAGAGSQVTLVESHLGHDGGPYLTNAVTEIVAGPGAVIDYCKLDEEGAEGHHFATVRVRQEAGSRFTSHAISLSGALVRNDLGVALDGEGAECDLFGLYLLSGRQHVDNHTTIDHLRPHCTSREVYKGILDGRATAVFNGAIVVRPDAQKTTARQTNKNLLLSRDAVIDTKPQLEIHADDVKCNHGATIGQLDPGALFYLRSRGIGLEEARRLLVNAFGAEIIEGIKLRTIQCRLDLALVTRLSQAQRAQEAT